jgi:hypothetical protein
VERTDRVGVSWVFLVLVLAFLGILHNEKNKIISAR